MKKLLAFVLALCLLCGAVAFADNTITTDNGTGTTELKLTIGETFTLTIPTTLNVALSDEPTNLPLTISDYNLATNHQLSVKVSAALNGWLKNENGETIGVQLLHPDNDTWAGSANPIYFTENGTENIRVKVSGYADAKPGTYTDTVTIMATIVDK